jgi:hypothetical protein
MLRRIPWLPSFEHQLDEMRSQRDAWQGIAERLLARATGAVEEAAVLVGVAALDRLTVERACEMARRFPPQGDERC